MQKLLCKIVGYLAALRQPKFLVRLAINLYTKKYKINLNEFDLDKEKIQCFSDFFSRKFKDEKLNFEGEYSSPVDAFVYANGIVRNDRILQIKNQEIEVSDLLIAEQLPYKSYFSFYLGPGDYHRVHAPSDMIITEIKHIPGKYYSVRPQIAKKKKVFLKNERVLINAESPSGPVSLVLIAAINVGDIRLHALNNQKIKSKEITYQKITGKNIYKKGDDLGYFNMGSSVVLFLPVEANESDEVRRIRLGESLL